MVNAQELRAGVGEDGFDAEFDDELTEEIEDSDADLEPSDDADPLADIREAISELTEFSKKFSDFDPTSVRRELGHIRSLQSRVDSLANANPLEAINPRVATNEELLGSLVDALIESDILEDSSKASLRSSKERLAQSKTEQEWERRERELLSKVNQAAAPEQSGPDPELASYVSSKTNELAGYARGKGVELTSLGGELQFKPGETVDQAFDRVLGLIDSKAEEGSSAERLAGRRRAAGTKPDRRAAGQSDMDKYESYGRGEIDLKGNELNEIEKRLQEQGLI